MSDLFAGNAELLRKRLAALEDEIISVRAQLILLGDKPAAEQFTAGDPARFRSSRRVDRD